MSELNKKIFHEVSDENCFIVVDLNDENNVREVLEAMIDQLANYVKEEGDLEFRQEEHNAVAPYFGVLAEDGTFQPFKPAPSRGVDPRDWYQYNVDHFYSAVVKFPGMGDLLEKYVAICYKSGPILARYGEYNVGMDAAESLAFIDEKYVPLCLDFLNAQDLNHAVYEYGTYMSLLSHYEYQDCYFDIALELITSAGHSGCDLLAERIGPDIPVEKMDHFLKLVTDATYDMDKPPRSTRDLCDDMINFELVFASVFRDEDQEKIKERCNAALNAGNYPTVAILLGRE